jgi:hypothetical protein
MNTAAETLFGGKPQSLWVGIIGRDDWRFFTEFYECTRMQFTGAKQGQSQFQGDQSIDYAPIHRASFALYITLGVTLSSAALRFQRTQTPCE